MKTQLLLFLSCAATVLDAYAAEPTTNSPVVALCFVTAADAFTAIQQKLGTNAAEAVSQVDEKRNTVALNSTHSQAGIVRAFLTGLDHRPPEIRVDATITRHREATGSSPAREEVLSRRLVIHQAARPEAFSIPEEHGSTRIELRATQLSR
ncbi:MAG: hypothetical protein QOF48_510 [Verrucomicrobiota bacterium]|jgi:hypothetical protein